MGNMPEGEINSKYVFTDGEILSFKVNYMVPREHGFVIGAIVKIKAKHALPDDKFEFSNLELKFTSVISLYISEDFTKENKIKNMTLKRLDNGVFYISLQPYNNSNEPHEKDNFVITAQQFTFDLLNS